MAGMYCPACKHPLEQPFGLTECPTCGFPFSKDKLREWVQSADSALEYRRRIGLVMEARLATIT